MRLLLAATLALVPALAWAQSGHFITGGANNPVCTDEGTTVLCTGKVAGLGGTTFEIVVEAEGTAIVECRNQGGNVAPGQDTEVDVTGSTGPLETPRNGQFVFEVETAEPTVSSDACPNPRWTAEVVDVEFGTATLRLFEDGLLVDQETVQVQ